MSTPIRVVVTPKLADSILDIARALTPSGVELDIVPFGSPEFYDRMRDTEYYVGLPLGGGTIGGEFFRAAPRLKLVQLISAGYDHVDLEAARKAGIPVCNNGGANSIAVAEHAIMLMLAAAKRLVWHHGNVVAGKWRVADFAQARAYELAGKTLGIIGLGNIGKKVARRAQAFDMTVQYHDLVRLTEAQEDALGARFVLRDELLRTSDVVSLHVPLNDTTRRMIGARELALMKPTAILVNTSRGPVIDDEALVKALTTGQIHAAGLDVMVEEPPARDHPLFSLPNVTLTPHSAGPTWDNWSSRFRNAFDNIQRVASGQRPFWVIPELRDTRGA